MKDKLYLVDDGWCKRQFCNLIHSPQSQSIFNQSEQRTKQKDAYIATQGLLQNIVEGFWNMFVLKLINGQESSYCFWPEEVGEVMVCGRLRVRL